MNDCVTKPCSPANALSSRLASLAFGLAFFLTWNPLPSAVAADSGKASPDRFVEQLHEMLDREESSIKAVRSQIVESSQAPFLPELYMRLAELLTQKSNTLYYLQMEKNKSAPPKKKDERGSGKDFSPVIEAQKEAISVYHRILRDFPRYKEKSRVLLSLVVAYRSIDETAPFIATCTQLISEFPNSEEAMRVRLLLAQHWFDQSHWSKAQPIYEKVESVSFAYERNLAKHRLGLILANQRKFKEALRKYEQVIRDPDLKEQDNPYSISLEKRTAKLDLKREALLDSVRAFTSAFPKEETDPVQYFSGLAPTEGHFQETLEKLAARYISLKKYVPAVRILRAIAERTLDPLKIIANYKDVLRMIPSGERAKVEPSEMRFVLEHLAAWLTYYDIPKKLKDSTWSFFEKNIRSFGTASHERAKKERRAGLRSALLHKARDFYLMYLYFFEINSNSVKMALDLADVYFHLGQFLESGEWYLRTYGGEFGASSNKLMALDNAMIILQKQMDTDFYRALRRRGLLIHAIESVMRERPKKKTDAELNFALLKTQYEQGFFPEVFDSLLDFARANKRSKRAMDAVDLILDYFNTRNDFNGLYHWADRIQSVGIRESSFTTKLQRLKSQAKSRAILEKAKDITRESGSFDDFDRGKSFLAVALTSESEAFANEALKQALAQSKREKDLETFNQAAKTMAAKETDTQKRVQILRSVAQESAKATRFIDAIGIYLEIALKTPGVSKAIREKSIDDALGIALTLRDLELAHRVIRSAQIDLSLANRTRERMDSMTSEALLAGKRVPDALVVALFNRPYLDDRVLLALFKSQFRLDSRSRSNALQAIAARCGEGSRQTVCRWHHLERLDIRQSELRDKLARAPLTLKGIEWVAPQFSQYVSSVQNQEGSGDPELEIALYLRMADNFRIFSSYLARSAVNNGELKTVLNQKAKEAAQTSESYLKRCQSMSEQSRSAIDLAGYCKNARIPDLTDLLGRGSRAKEQSLTDDPDSEAAAQGQKDLFGSDMNPALLLKMSQTYLDERQPHHAIASATYGAAAFKSQERDFRAVMGCSAFQLGYEREASYHLRNANSLNGLREKCQSLVQSSRWRK